MVGPVLFGSVIDRSCLLWEKNVTAAQEPASITIIIRWLGCCSLSALRARWATSCVVYSAGSCTREGSVKAMFHNQDLNIRRQLVNPEIMFSTRLLISRSGTAIQQWNLKSETTYLLINFVRKLPSL